MAKLTIEIDMDDSQETWEALYRRIEAHGEVLQELAQLRPNFELCASSALLEPLPLAMPEVEAAGTRPGSEAREGSAHVKRQGEIHRRMWHPYDSNTSR